MDPEEFTKNLSDPLPSIDNEVKIKSLKVVDKSFLYEIEPSLNAFEQYLLSEYGECNATFPYLFYERTGLVH